MRRILAICVLLFLIFPLSRTARAEEIPFREGDRIVIWHPDSEAALSGTEESCDVFLDQGILTGFSQPEIWTLSQNPDRSWRLEQDGHTLSLGDDYDYLTFSGPHSGWRFIPSESGMYRIENTGRDQCLCLNARRRTWTTCGLTETRAGHTEFALYLLPREEEDTPILPPEMPEGYRLYFGALHAHTDLSDGEGTVEEAFQYASQVEGLDFFAVTDHSHSFDNGKSATLDASPDSTAWHRGKAAAQAVTDTDFVGIFGFEMTWNQGQGHMNTFATPGFLSRETDAFQSYATGMEAYFHALTEVPQSISQFNHPGLQYGDFKDFSGYTPKLDRQISLIEVESDTRYYDRALRLGWHLAPTMSQNNHAGQWGGLDGRRTVLLARGLTEDALYDALRNYRVYATQDPDLEILFSLDGHPMGSRVPRHSLGNTLTLECQLYDPTDPALGTLEVVTQDGCVLETLSLEGPKADLSLTLPANRDYYYLRLTQPDGSWAVTAPIWLDEQNHLGISEISLSPTLTAGKPEIVTVTLYNAEPQDLTVSHVTLQVGETLYTHTGPLTLLPFTSLPVTFSHTFASDGVCTITAEAAGAYDGANRRFTDSQTVTVLPPELVDDVILLCPEESRTGFSRLMALAEEKDVDLTICTALPDLTTCRLLILTADAPAPEKQAVRDHLLRGGSLLLCGISPEIHPEIIPQLNELLESVGASGRFLPEEARDEISNQGQPHQLRTAVFAQSIWTEALEEGQYFRQDRGCAIDPGAGQWLVKGLETAGSPVLLSAEETESGGWIFLSGGTLFPDGHLPPTDAWALPSGNQTILESLLGLLHSPQPTIPIASLREAEPEHIYLAEGRITAGTANPHTTFPNTVYLEDATGGIAATGYSTHGLPLGSRVQILGVLVRQGENPQLQILRLTELGRESPLLPTPDIPGKDTGGKLLQTAGVVTAFSTRDGVISRFSLDHGVEILVEPEIRSASRGRNELSRIVRAGNTLRAVGLCHHDGENWVLRLRDCDEVTLLSGTPAPVPEENPDPWPPEDPSDSEESLPIEPTDESRPGTENPAATDPAAPTEDPKTGEIPDTGDPIGTLFGAWWISLAGLLSFRKKRK